MPCAVFNCKKHKTKGLHDSLSGAAADPIMHWWEGGERPGQIISPRLGGLTHRRWHSHIISSPPGLHVGGLWVENRRPGEEPTRGGGGHVNFTQRGSGLICEPWTCSAVRVYLTTGHTKSILLHLLLLFSVKKIACLFWYFFKNAARFASFGDLAPKWDHFKTS